MNGPSATRGSSPRRRLSGLARRAEILEAARRLVVEQGHLPLSMEALAGAAGVSKALVYSHFPDQNELYNALVGAELDDLDEHGGKDLAFGGDDLPAAACAAADVYFVHVASRGTVLHLIYRDPYMAGRLSARAVHVRDHVLGGFARGLRSAFGLPAREAVAAVSLVLTVPEETGRLVFQGDLTLERGHLVCRELVLGCLTALGEPV